MQRSLAGFASKLAPAGERTTLLDLAEKHAFRYGYALLYNLGKRC